MKIIKVSEEVRTTLDLASKNHWGFRVIGQGDMIDSPVIVNEWLFVPLDQDDFIIPPKGLNRVSAVGQTGVGIKGVIVAHEAPRLLTAPKAATAKVDVQSSAKQASELILRVLGAFFSVLGYMFLFSFAALLDPALIVVLEDGTWVEVMRWFE